MSESVHPILKRWQKLSGKPMGPWLFSKGLGRMVPYTGTIHPEVVDLRPGHAKISMKDRKGVRNHLESIHAIALINLAEVTSGLAMMCTLPADARGIVTGLKIDYHKKARGRLTATCDCEPTGGNEERHIAVESVVRDEAGDVVATAVANWKIGPRT